MRGVADQRDAVGDERACDEKAERMDAPRADDLDLAEMQLEALLELGVKIGIAGSAMMRSASARRLRSTRSRSAVP